MNKKALASELRELERALTEPPFLSPEEIDRLSDDKIIHHFISCENCGVAHINKLQLNHAIQEAEDADHFFEICEIIESQNQEFGRGEN